VPLIARLETFSAASPSLRIVTLLALLAVPPCTSLKGSRDGVVLMFGEMLAFDTALAPTPTCPPARAPPDTSIAQPIDRANRRSLQSRAPVVIPCPPIIRRHSGAADLTAG
jgi:hypothetical protein